MSTVTRLLTYEEWIDMPTVEDGIEEVVKGELRFMPPNHANHAEVISRIVRRLHASSMRNRYPSSGRTSGR